MQETVFGAPRDILFMQRALAHATRAADRDEVPVGAVVVDPQGAIIGWGYNKVETHGTQRAHAEMAALEMAAKRRGNWRLDECWLYVTLEPCAMCIGMAKLSRVSGVIYGADSPLYGYRLDSALASWVYTNGPFEVVRGVCADESAAMLKAFFQKKRKKGE